MSDPSDDLEYTEPVFAPWDGRRVPVTLLGGYLGSGKTTVINELLARTTVPIAVLVNDVGAVNVDAALIERRSGDTIDLAGGCVCCSLKNGFLEAFEQIREREIPPEHVVVELSGLADPRAVVGLAETPGFSVDGVVVLIDLDQFLEFDASDSVVSDSIHAQIDGADVLLLTKRDLVDAAHVDRVTQRLAELRPDVAVMAVESVHSAAGIIGLAARTSFDGDLGPSLFDQYDVSVVPVPDKVSRSDLSAMIDALGSDVIRVKGIVEAEGGETVLVQVVGRRRSIERLPAAETRPMTDLIVVSTR